MGIYEGISSTSHCGRCCGSFCNPQNGEVENYVIADTEQLVSVVKESVAEPVAKLPRMATTVSNVAEKNEGDTVRTVTAGKGDNVNDDKVYDVVEKMPSFPGGLHAMMVFLTTNIHYPKESLNTKEQGRVVITFDILMVV